MSALEAQMRLPPVREVGGGLGAFASRIRASADRVQDRIVRDEGTAQAVLDVCAALQGRWLDELKAMPDLSGDAAQEKRREDFCRAVALGIELSAQVLTNGQRLDDAFPRVGHDTEK